MMMAPPPHFFRGPAGHNANGGHHNSHGNRQGSTNRGQNGHSSSSTLAPPQAAPLALEFDFEGAITEVMPDLVEDGGDGDKRHRTVVCRHWLKGLCKKSDRCEFLHRMDLDKMPICRWGAACQLKDCQYRHINEEDKPECAYYKQGFCKEGNDCRYRHVKRPPEDLAEEADFSLAMAMQEEAASKGLSTNPGNGINNPNEFFKTTMCKHWLQSGGFCPFNDKCHFAHGEQELIKLPGRDKAGGGGAVSFRGGGGGAGQRGGAGEGGDHKRETASLVEEDPEVVKQLPLLHGQRVMYFVLKSLSLKNLAVSVGSGRWSVRKAHRRRLNDALSEAQGCNGKVILIFTVSGKGSFQGCAEMKAPIPEGPGPTGGPLSWSALFAVEWLRVCDLPFSKVPATLRTGPPPHGAPLTACRDGSDVPYDVGRALLLLMYSAPVVEVTGEAMKGNIEVKEIAFEDREGTLVPVNPNRAMFSTPAGQWGYLFNCSADTINETLGKMLFGLPAHQANEARKAIVPGSPLFLLDISKRMLFGIFAAETALTELLDPSAWARPGQRSPLPAQVKVRVILEVPPVPESDPEVADALAQWPKKQKHGVLEPAMCQLLATILAERAGGSFPARG